MGPYDPEEVFQLNDWINPQFHPTLELVTIDNMFKDYKKIRDLFYDTPAPMMKIRDGTRNFIDYYHCRQHLIFKFKMVQKIQNFIKSVWGVDTYHVENAVYTNWFKMINPRKSDHSNPHTDPSDFAVLTYLNTEEECSGGTSIFEWFDTNNKEYPVTYWTDTTNLPRLCDIEMKPGRTVIFNCINMVHAAWHPDNAFINHPRLTMIMWFNDVRRQLPCICSEESVESTPRR